MNFGFSTTAPCVNTPPTADSRCEDPAFAAANPDLCPARTQLIIKPEVALVCALGSTQFGAFVLVNGVETDVTADAVFATSNPAIALVGAASGNATGISQGSATISATYSTYTATAVMTVIGTSDDCCSQQQVAMMLVVDNSRSMSQAFTGSYGTRLDYAKAAATRFISEVNENKDIVGLLRFNNTDTDILSAPAVDKDAVEALVPLIVQTDEKTGFYDALNEAIAQLDATSADLKVVVLISDGEDTSDGAGNNYAGTNNPMTLARTFRDAGGIIICLGCRASGAGFALLSEFSTGGFFVNGYSGTESTALDFLSGLKGYICAGDCTPAGDLIVATPSLDYTGFANWDVSGGKVDLIGPGLFDFLPGNGLYVDLAGSTQPAYGKMVSKAPFALHSGDTYRLSLELAGNQRIDLTPYAVTVKVYYLADATEIVLLSQAISINDYTQDFEPYSFSFVSPGDVDAYISIQQTSVPSGSGIPYPTLTPYYGLLLNSVTLDNVTDSVNLLNENFDEENLQYIPPRCGIGTTWYNGGYAIGTYCYYGEGCLDEPPPVQSPDPNPLADIESGSTPPTTFTSTKQACASCPDGQVNVIGDLTPSDALIPVMTSNTAPSGTASASSDLGGEFNGLPWNAFDGNVNTGWTHSNAEPNSTPSWLIYDFGVATEIAAYSLKLLYLGEETLYFRLQGSNDGTNWNTIHEQFDITAATAGEFTFQLTGVENYSAYRIWLSGTEDLGVYPIWVMSFQLYTASGYEIGPTQVCKEATATSTVSQAKADADAYAAALALAQADLNCVAAYTWTDSYTATCEFGTVSATASATATSFQDLDDAKQKAHDAAKLLAEAALDCTQSTNAQAITLPATNWNGAAYGPATPFPSVKYVEDTGAIADVTVTLTGLQPCPNGNSWLMLLESPEGTVVLLWADQGSTQVITAAVDIDFNDAGAAMPVNPVALTSGTYAPNNGGVDPILTVPGSAPQPPYSFSLSAFVGEERQGAWGLWILLRTNVASSIASGWDLTIT